MPFERSEVMCRDTQFLRCLGDMKHAVHGDNGKPIGLWGLKHVFSKKPVRTTGLGRPAA